MDTTVLLIFAFVYVGMILGRIPGLGLDRTGMALLGIILLLVTERMTATQAWQAVDVQTIALLFGLMVISAQFRLGGFYAHITHRLAGIDATPDVFLAILIAVAGGLAALLSNDVVCLAIAPVLAEVCSRRKLDPIPFLLALACATNVGSAATLIGNPQNILIGQSLKMSFAGYLLDGGVPSVIGLAGVWWVIRWIVGGRWHKVTGIPDQVVAPLNLWQTAKGLAVLALVVLAFLFSPWPRELIALAGAGVLLVSRKLASRSMLALVDWQLLLLFVGLFVVNHALQVTGTLAHMTAGLRNQGLDLSRPVPLFAGTVVLSNLVSNVPATMLLLPVAKHPLAGPILALASTLAGNLLVVGSIANIIVIDQSARLNLRISWRDHARIGIPVTIVTLVIAAAWLALRAAFLR
jgi:Na+/H+ antiporter NhaD/arsenite permease-like protein